MHLRRISIDGPPPITHDQVLNHIGQGWCDNEFEQRIANQLIPAALYYAEETNGIAIQKSTWEYIRTGWPATCSGIEMPRPFHRCVTEFSWSAGCGDWQTLPETDFRIEKPDTGWTIFPCECWPGRGCSCSGCEPKVKIIFEAGYDTPKDVPGTLVEGLLLYVEHLIDRSNDSTLELAKEMIAFSDNRRTVGHYG